MSVVTNPIHLARPSLATAPAESRAENSGGAPARVALTARGERSIAPQNLVELSWKDVIDAVNPLQQLPVVGEIYRGITGSTISGLSRVAGGFIYGGIAGGLVSALTAAYAEANDGQGPGEQIVAALAGTGKPDTVAASVYAAAKDTTKDAAEALAQAADRVTGASAGTGGDAVPTVTVTAQDAANIHDEAHGATLTPRYARAEAMIAQTAAGQNMAGQQAAATNTPGLPPLRERLNHKQATPGFSSSTRPLTFGNGNFIERMPANAAALSAMQAQNLQILQGVGIAPAGAVAKAEAAVSQQSAAQAAQTMAQNASQQGRNPLPPDLVRDMMMQAMDKYEKLPPVVPETGAE